MSFYRVEDGPRFELVEDAPASARVVVARLAAFRASVSEPPAPALDGAGRLVVAFVPPRPKVRRKRGLKIAAHVPPKE